MGELAIHIENVSKCYSIGKKKDTSLRGTISGIFNSAAGSKEDFWALKDINFDVERGSVVGIIGKNGAGKSTLLKVLSQITHPTTGKIEINGRVASLLEVGTGFHPELTGRENIFLNGTILGMSRKEVKDKFDEIVAFSGVEKFIDTPVKRYSSGMYVRLAFAVAAHLEPEILIIDEVLAVGDASFQKKCLGKMSDIASEGRTVLFVSHDMGAVASLCTHGILLEAGSVAHQGSISEIIDAYMNIATSQENNVEKYAQKQFHEWDEKIILTDVSLINSDSQNIINFNVDQKVGVRVRFEVLNAEKVQPIPNIHISHSLGGKVMVTVNPCDENAFATKGKHEAIAWIPENTFNTGFFNLGVAISTLDPVEVHVADYDALSFEVVDNLNSLSRNGYTGKIDGYIRPILEWENKSMNR